MGVSAGVSSVTVRQQTIGYGAPSGRALTEGVSTLLAIRLLGEFEVLRDGTPLSLPPSRKTRALLPTSLQPVVVTGGTVYARSFGRSQTTLAARSAGA